MEARQIIHFNNFVSHSIVGYLIVLQIIHYEFDMGKISKVLFMSWLLPDQLSPLFLEEWFIKSGKNHNKNNDDCQPNHNDDQPRVSTPHTSTAAAEDAASREVGCSMEIGS